MTEQADPAPACTLVIFGATGDLTKRLLVPALVNLARGKLLARNFSVIGVARSEKTDKSFRSELADGIKEFANQSKSGADWKWLAKRISYLSGDFAEPETYKELAARLAKASKGGGNVLFYLATPPSVFSIITGRLGRLGLLKEAKGLWRRIIIEKPFGTDLKSAQELNRKLLADMSEEQIYRIDHYLGKETVQNIIVLRFGNGIFEPLWNRNHIDHVQITVAETVGVEARGKFYDATGALRDMIPNHLFQLLELVAMEPPSCFDADAVRSEKSQVLEAVHAFGSKDAIRNVVRGQYTAGKVGRKVVAAYRKSKDVARNSTTETYVALKVMIDNWRWAGVPFYLRTGKALGQRQSQVVIRFKQAPFAIFRDTPVERLTPNDLVIQIQPEESVTLSFGVKKPGPKVSMDGVEMKFDYKEHFQLASSTGYETLIYDCMTGDTTLFKRAREIENGWRIVQPVLDAWAKKRRAPFSYSAGDSGPKEADELLARDGRQWRPLAKPKDTK